MDIHAIFPDLELKIIPKRGYILNEGEISHNIFYLKKGIVRIVHNLDGREVTAQFFSDDSMLSFRADSFKHIPGKYSIQALEECEIYVISRDKLFEVLKDEQKAHDMFFMIVERVRLYQELYLMSIALTPQQRYEQLRESQPQIIERVPQHYIASYLGITPVSLSRIRNKK